MTLITHLPTRLSVDTQRRRLFYPDGTRATLYRTADGVEVVMVLRGRTEGSLWSVERILQEARRCRHDVARAD